MYVYVYSKKFSKHLIQACETFTESGGAGKTRRITPITKAYLEKKRVIFLFS